MNQFKQDNISKRHESFRTKQKIPNVPLKRRHISGVRAMALFIYWWFTGDFVDLLQ